MRNTSEIFKAEGLNKTTVTKKDGPSPFNATGTTTKPFNNPLRQSVKKPAAAATENTNTEKDAVTKEFDLNQSNQKRKVSTTATAAAGYQNANTMNSEKNAFSVGSSSNADKDLVELLEDGEENLSLEIKKANSGAVTGNASNISKGFFYCLLMVFCVFYLFFLNYVYVFI